MKATLFCVFSYFIVRINSIINNGMQKEETQGLTLFSVDNHCINFFKKRFIFP